jgi:hypothetical protein
MELFMSIKTRFTAIAVAAVVAAAGVVSTAAPAEAHGFRAGWGIGAGLLGAAVVGSAIAATTPYPYYYGGYPHCGWVRQFDSFGNYVGTVRNCY